MKYLSSQKFLSTWFLEVLQSVAYKLVTWRNASGVMQSGSEGQHLQSWWYKLQTQEADAPA